MAANVVDSSSPTTSPRQFQGSRVPKEGALSAGNCRKHTVGIAIGVRTRGDAQRIRRRKRELERNAHGRFGSSPFTVEAASGNKLGQPKIRTKCAPDSNRVNAYLGRLQCRLRFVSTVYGWNFGGQPDMEVRQFWTVQTFSPFSSLAQVKTRARAGSEPRGRRGLARRRRKGGSPRRPRR